VRFVVPILLLIGALGAWRQAEEVDRDVALAEPVGAPQLSTPVLAGRRLPTYLARPVVDTRLIGRLRPWIEGSPEKTCLVVADGGRPIAAHLPGEALVPASAAKVLTALALLEHIEATQGFETLAMINAPIEDGVLEGDLWIVGAGDPLLATSDYIESFEGDPPRSSAEQLADSVLAAGITRIEGSVIGDESRFDSERYVESWPDRYVEQNQSGPLSALTMDDGFGEYPEVAGAERAVPTEEPAVLAAQVVADLLVERGVEVDRAARSGTRPDAAQTIGSVPSLPVEGLVEEMLTASDNMAAELLLKQIGVLSGGEGSTEAGAEEVEQVVADLGLPAAGLEVVDGSGLDQGNRASCQLLVAALDHGRSDGPIGQGLAVAGQTGTMGDRFLDSPALGLVRAKTGSLNSVTALAGFVDTEVGGPLTFATIVNIGEDELAEDEPPSVEQERLRQEELTEILLTYPELPEPELIGPLPPAP